MSKRTLLNIDRLILYAGVVCCVLAVLLLWVFMRSAGSSGVTQENRRVLPPSAPTPPGPTILQPASVSAHLEPAPAGTVVVQSQPHPAITPVIIKTIQPHI